MAKTSTPPVIAVFPNRGLADAAIDKLLHAGFDKNKIGLASPGEAMQPATTATTRIEDRAADGAERLQAAEMIRRRSPRIVLKRQRWRSRLCSRRRPPDRWNWP